VSNVVIHRKALDTAIVHARGSPDNEIIGVLIGKQKGNDLVITDAVPSDHGHSDNVSVSLLNEFQALVAEKLMREGSTDYIVGIYHSHPGFGCFFSDTDTGTQMRIQQMFPQAVALVIDPFQKGGVDYRFYQVEAGSAVELRPMVIGEPRIPERPVSPVVSAPAPAAPAVPLQQPIVAAAVSPACSESKIPLYIAIGALIVALCALAFAGMAYLEVTKIPVKAPAVSPVIPESAPAGSVHTEIPITSVSTTMATPTPNPPVTVTVEKTK
jgi:proteasome lid subunit RPN8/RPN11